MKILGTDLLRPLLYVCVLSTEIEDADQTCYLIQLQRTDSWPTRPRSDNNNNNNNNSDNNNNNEHISRVLFCVKHAQLR